VGGSTAVKTAVAEESVAAPEPGPVARLNGRLRGKALPPFAILLSAVLLGAAGLRFFRLGHQSLWLDEILSVDRARTLFTEGLDAQLLNGHGPLFFYLIAPLMPLHPGEALLRLPSALLGIGLVAAMYVLGKEFDDRRGGLVAAAVTALSPYAIWYSQEARYVSLFMVLAALSLVFMRRLMRGTDRDLALYIVVTILMLLSFVGGIFLLIAQNVWMLLLSKARAPTLRRWVLGQAIVLLVFVPWLVRAYRIDVNPLTEAEDHDFSVATLRAGYPRATEPMQLGYVFLVFGVGYSFGPSTNVLHHDPTLEPVKAAAVQIVAAVALIGMVGLAGILRMAKRSWRDATLVALGVVAPVLGAYLLASVSRIAFNVRYTSGAFPAFILFMSAGLLWWKERFRVGGVVVGGLLAVVGMSLVNHYANPDYFKEDSRGVARLLEQQRRPEERVLVGASLIPLEYYYHRPLERWSRVSVVQHPPPASPSPADPARVWVAATRTWQSHDFQRFLDAMDGCYPVDARYELPGYEVLAYQVGASPNPANCTLVESGKTRGRGGRS
jgi:4-amino-4-deoxy-L-arabinose transferase-like glycosyltransferase